MLTSQVREELIATLERCAESDAEQVVVQRVINTLAPALRMYELDLLSSAADEATAQLAPGAVTVHVSNGEPTLRVTPPPPSTHEGASDDVTDSHHDVTSDAKATARLTLRLPERLKQRVESAASSSGSSVNTWVVDALATAVAEGQSPRQQWGSGSRITGWAN